MIWHQIVRTILPFTHRIAHGDLNARKAQLLDYAGNQALEEIQDMESALHTLQVRLPAIGVERLDPILDGSETVTDVDELVAELVAELLRLHHSRY
jgi:hypothetical protein